MTDQSNVYAALHAVVAYDKEKRCFENTGRNSLSELGVEIVRLRDQYNDMVRKAYAALGLPFEEKT